MRPFVHDEVTTEMLRQFEKKSFERRRTGRSTAIALRTIAEAIDNPCKPIKVSDHFDGPHADRFLLGTIGEMIKQLDLNGFVFNQSDRTLRFFLYEKDYRKAIR